MVKINLKELDRDIFIRGNDAAARTITIGRTDTFDDVIVVDGSNWSVTAAGNASFGGTLGVTGATTLASTLGVTGATTFTGAVTFNNTLTAQPTANSEIFGASAGNPGSITGTHNTIFGASAGTAVTTGTSNTFVGFGAGIAAAGLSTSTFIGRGAGASVVSGTASTAIGYNAMNTATNDGMTAIGANAMGNSNGDNNLAIGTNALLGSAVTPHTGQFNVAIGANALLVIEGGVAWNNTAIGGNSLTALTTAGGNTCIGKDTGKAITTGGSNVFIGNATGDNTTTGGSNILIGSGLDTTATNSTGELKIHYAGGSNIPLISGDMVTGKMGVNTLALRTATLNIQTDSADAVDCLLLDQDDVSENFIQFTSTMAASAVNPLTSWTTGNSIQGFFRVDINGTARWVPFYDAPTS